VEEAGRAVEGPLAKVNSAEAFLIRGMYLYAAHDYRAALAEYLRAEEASPQLPTLRYHIARARVALGHTEEALTDLNAEAAANPESFNVNALLGWVLTRLQRPDEAVGPLRKALAQRPDDSALLWTLGGAYGALRQDDEAIELLERAVAIEPALTPAHALLGQLYARKRRKADAARQAEIVRELEARDQAVHSGKGQAEAPPEFGRKPVR
jgi:tetratricopeptide (TPR) repeat protein